MRSIFRVAAVLAAATLPIVALSASQAEAKPKPRATPQIIVTCSQNPVVETGQSLVQTVCQVEANPSNAGSLVTVSSTQLASRCTGGSFFDNIGFPNLNSITFLLDNDGNATLIVYALHCAPGSTLIDASLDAPPFSTALTKLVIEPPQVTPPGVHVFPNPEVEVGDNPTAASPNNTASEADFVFFVETNPVYAEQVASITSDQLTERCGDGFYLLSYEGQLEGTANHFFGNFPHAGGISGVVVNGPIDNDGNTVFTFAGASSAAGKSTVIAEIGGGGPTYSTQVAILPPAVTI